MKTSLASPRATCFARARSTAMFLQPTGARMRREHLGRARDFRTATQAPLDFLLTRWLHRKNSSSIGLLPGEQVVVCRVPKQTPYRNHRPVRASFFYGNFASANEAGL
jgi:hypothetical protein